MLVILEKSTGNVDITKSRVIPLLEVDFNTLNKILFNFRVIPLLEKHNSIPHKITGGCRDYLAVHIALNKKLILDVSN